MFAARVYFNIRYAFTADAMLANQKNYRLLQEISLIRHELVFERQEPALLKLKLLPRPHREVTRGTHYDADATMAVPELTRNSFYILFPAKGIMNYRQIISSRLRNLFTRQLSTFKYR